MRVWYFTHQSSIDLLIAIQRLLIAQITQEILKPRIGATFDKSNRQEDAMKKYQILNTEV